MCVGAGCLAAAACGTTYYQYNFEENGGAEVADLSIAEGEEFTLPVPVRDGFGFEGWYDNADFTGNPVETVVASEHATFFAKWAQLYKITVNLDGGSLADADKLALKEGGNVYDYMKDKVPTKSGLTFGAWFVGNNELGSNTRMTTAGITLDAKYKVGYTVEIWKQKSDNAAEYEMDAEATVSGNEYVGVTYTADVEQEGFTVVSNSSAVASKVLTANAAENVLKLYFDRIDCNVTFVPNYPDGSAGGETAKTVKYGEEVTVPDNLTCAGYCLKGWATSPDGEVEYEVDSIAATLYNGTKPEAVKFTPKRSNTRLYAVWSKGYTNMFAGNATYGGDDTLFHLSETDTDIYLLRGGTFFKGTYNTENKRFIFVVNPDLQLIGQLKDDGTYIYSNLSRSEISRPKYTIDGGISETEEIQFDEFNGLTYIVTAENNTTTQSQGVYVVDSNGYYVTTFTTGALAGQTLTIRLVDLTSSSGGRYPAFMVRNEREAAMGEIYRCGVSLRSGAGIGYMTAAYQITLDGFGTATMNMGTSNQQYAYSMDYSEENPALTFTYSDSFGQRHEMKFIIMEGIAPSSETSAGYGYMYYREDYDVTITAESGATLKMDGLSSAEYHNGSTNFEGYFLSSSWSVFGQMVVTLANDNTRFTVIVESTTTEINGERVTKYNFIEKPEGYIEYFYRTETGVDEKLMLAYNDLNERYVDADNSIDVTLNSTAYGLDEQGNRVPVSYGVTTYDEVKREYKYKAYKYLNVALAESVIDLNQLGEITFTTGTTSIGTSIISITFNVLNALEVKTKANEVVEGVVETYNSVKGGTLTLTSGYAVYVEEGKRFMGTYAPSNTNPNLLRIADTELGGYAYVIVNGDDNTFVSLVTPPYSTYALLANGSASQTERLDFDGTETGVTYFDGTNSFAGTFAETGTTTLAGFIEYLFTSQDGTVSFKFIRPSSSSAMYFAKYNEAYHGTYSLGGVSSLTLDGYSVAANFVDAEGVRYERAVYMILEENVAVVAINNGYRYFDLKNDGTCTIRGTEYGQYRLSENRYENGVMFALDGYGKAKVYDLNDNPDAGSFDEITTFIDEDATYTMSGDLVTVVYKKNGADTVTVEGKLGAYRYLNRTILIFITVNEEIVRTFVSEADWSVLILSDIGNVTKYDAYGISSQGTYRIITDEYFYFSGTNEQGLYKYSLATGKVNPVKYSERGFYTSDLKALQFASYGFAAANGTTPYYYYMDGAEVFMYKSDPSNANANKYGFVRDTQITAFEDELTFDGETYVTNSGFQVVFTRSGSIDQYPITVNNGTSSSKLSVRDLRFSPAGTEEFSVAGLVTLGDNTYNCTVVRTKVEDAFETYILFSNNLRLYINLTYRGSGNSTYTVTDMKQITELMSYNYMAGYINAIFGGGELPLDLGTITLFRQYDENGDVSEDYAYSEFNEKCSILGVNGEVLNFKSSDYSSSNGLTINFTGADGYKYKLGAQLQSFMGRVAYVLSYVARVQTLTDANSGYSIDVSRVIFSETAEAGGYLNDYVVKDADGNELPVDAKGRIGEDLFYISRTFETLEDDKKGKILSTVYIKIELKDKDEIQDGDGEEEPAVKVVPLYDSVVLTPIVMTTCYTADDKTYVDIDANNKVWIVNINSRLYVATECSYDADTQTYTVTLNNGRTYTVKIVEGKAVLTEVE